MKATIAVAITLVVVCYIGFWLDARWITHVVDSDASGLMDDNSIEDTIDPMPIPDLSWQEEDDQLDVYITDGNDIRCEGATSAEHALRIILDCMSTIHGFGPDIDYGCAKIIYDDPNEYIRRDVNTTEADIKGLQVEVEALTARIEQLEQTAVKWDDFGSGIDTNDYIFTVPTNVVITTDECLK